MTMHNLSSRPERSAASAVEGPAFHGVLCGAGAKKHPVSRLRRLIRLANHSAPLEMTDVRMSPRLRYG